MLRATLGILRLGTEVSWECGYTCERIRRRKTDFPLNEFNEYVRNYNGIAISISCCFLCNRRSDDVPYSSSDDTLEKILAKNAPEIFF